MESTTDRLWALSTFKEAVENSTDAIGLFTPDGRLFYQNRAFSEFCGDLIGNPTAQVYCDSKIFEDVWGAIMAGGSWTGEVRMYDKNRRIVTVLLRAYANKDESGKIVSLIGIHADIAGRKQSEEALRESESRLRSVIDFAPFGAHLYELDGADRLIFIGYNRSAERILGVDHEAFVGRTLAEAFPPLLQTEIPARYAEVARTGKTYTTEQIQYDHNGIQGAYEVCAVQTAPRRIAAFFRDITLQKRAEEALANERNLFMDLVASQPAGVYRLRVKGRDTWNEPEWARDVETHFRLELVSDLFCRILGVTRQQCEANAARIVDCVHAEDRPDFVRRNIIALQTVKPFDWEGRILNHGQVRWVHFASVPRSLPNGDILWTGVLLDISELKHAEETQRRIGMLESLGTVAGGIAHDFNNLLMGVFGNIELAQTELPDHHPIGHYLKSAHQALDNARRLTTRLLTFARGGNPVLEVVDLRQGICETVRFHLAGSNVAAQFDIPSDLWSIKADKGQIAEVIANLTLNAKDAMPAGGTLGVQARNIPDIHEAAAPELRGDFVQLIFRDTGVGIPAHLLERIFEPYFTTKQAGSGLGLAIVHGIVSKHKGHILVKSVPGIETQFILFLPADRGNISSLTPVVAGASPTPQRPSRRILLMDDEEIILKTARRMLERLGHSVETVQTGRDAIDQYRAARQGGHPFDAIIMDLTIPGGMGGEAAIKELLQFDPNAKAIVASGYSSDPVMSNFAAYGFCGYLAKPFSLLELDKALSATLPAGDAARS